ncbi:hypothetical protein OSB04_002967 [Centaurea solstitialis]|uniref:CCHC-type domain-containing protein n=1 Tax=Centaurea solstitialis TaxID=347529 RepID=A0AA38U6H0_9ASTR|nr:hypothetical protein OSB04_002967 [Centaurea solstitialis]
MALQAKDNYFETGSLGKPPRKELFLSGADPQIPYFLEHGPYVPTQTVLGVPATDNEPVIPPREMEKRIPNWLDEDRRLVSINTKARSLISMSLPDDVFHSICHLKTATEIWNTLCVQYEGTAVLMESRKIFLVRRYESFIHLKDETLSQTHQRFNCLQIDLKTIGTVYSNSKVITKFMESLPEYWETYTTCLTMSKDIKTLTLSELYGILLNREQQKKLTKNLIRDTKEAKSTSLALVSDSVPPVATSLVTITELESFDSEDISESDPDFNESLALLSHTFRKYARKRNFQRRKPLAITNKPKSAPIDKAISTCYNCEGKGHFANDCSEKGKGLIAEDIDWDDVSSDESSDEEDTQVALIAIVDEPTLALMAKIEEVSEEDTQVALIAIVDEPTLALMAKIEEVSEEAPSKAPKASTSATESSCQVSPTYIPLKSLTQLDLLTLDLYNALNDQVSVNQTLYVEREKATAAIEKALAELNAEEVYMTPPPGVSLPPGHVYRLCKALYGLKQAPRAWFEKFSNTVLFLGFSASNHDSGLFTRTTDSGTILFLLYVDDMIITGSDTTCITHLKQSFSSSFEMKDLGLIHYFLGLEVLSDTTGTYLCQAKHTSDLLSRAGITDNKVAFTPLKNNLHLPPNAGPPFQDPTLYRQLVGSLVYLTVTRLGITYAVHIVSQFMTAPCSDHYATVLRILRYLKGTMFHSLYFSSTSSLILCGFSDADWDSNMTDHRPPLGIASSLVILSFLSVARRSLSPLDLVRKLSIEP